MKFIGWWLKQRTAKQKAVSLFLVVVFIAALGINAFQNSKTSAQVDTFNSSGTWQAPAGITSVTVEAWGGGGAGGAANGNPSTGGGGAGGSYAIKVVTVTPSSNYTVTVGAGGTGGAGAGGAGGDSWFSTSGTIIAKGGAGGTNGASNSTNGAGATGSCTGCIGDATYAGGNGGTGNFTSGVDGSGAGGGAAGNTGAGGNASVNTAGTGTGEGATGASGVGNNTPGDIGGVPGGGGSGGKANNNPDRSGGSGGDGRVKITYNATATSVALGSPSNAATNVSLTPTFTLRAADPESDYLRYKIEVCSTSNCSSIVRTIDQTASQTGWSGQDTQGNTAYVGSTVVSASTIATHVYQAPALSSNTQYWWRGYAIDPAGSNAFITDSGISTFTTGSAPAAPTLTTPANSATGVDVQPIFELRTTDADGDYLRYKIDVCSTSNCSVIVRTINQSSSQTGWSGQDTQGGTAYVGSSVIGSSTLATHTYQLPKLDFSTQYWWRAYAIDPGGFNTESSASGIFTFTTMSPPTFTQIMGGTQIRGGTRIGN